MARGWHGRSGGCRGRATRALDPPRSLCNPPRPPWIDPRPAAARVAGAAARIAAALAGCTDWTPPQPPPVAAIPVYPDPEAHPPAAPAERPAASPFAATRDRILDRWLAEEPSLGRAAGLHQFDGKVGDYSAAGIAARLSRVEKDRAELLAVDPKGLGPDEALDLALLVQRADLLLFWGKDLEIHRRDPQSYEDLFSVDSYLTRDYAPLVERAERLLAHEEAALAQIPHIERNLASRLSRPVAKTSVKRFAGFAEYLRKDVRKHLAGVGSPAFQERLQKANEALAAAAAGLAERLARVEVKTGDDSHVLGPERYQKLLAAQEGLHLSLAELGKMGEENLLANKKAFDALAKKHVKLTPLKKEALFEEAGQLTAAARRFVVEKKLATIPTEEEAVVKETPPFMRWNAAFLDSPGVFEERPLRGFYYITLPDPSWPKKEQEEYLSPHGILLSTTIHEVYPGHFLQGQWLKRAPTRVQKLLTSYSFTEGWAHYGEQMMVEEGFGAESPSSRLGQLSDALLRNCRVVVSLGVHTAKMTMAEAERRFVRDCHQDQASAREQAARDAFVPGYASRTRWASSKSGRSAKRPGSAWGAASPSSASTTPSSPTAPLRCRSSARACCTIWARICLLLSSGGRDDHAEPVELDEQLLRHVHLLVAEHAGAEVGHRLLGAQLAEHVEERGRELDGLVLAVGAHLPRPPEGARDRGVVESEHEAPPAAPATRSCLEAASRSRSSSVVVEEAGHVLLKDMPATRSWAAR